MGTPNPVMPWMKLENPQPMSSACVRRSSARRAIALPMALMPSSLSTRLNIYTDAHTMVSTNTARLSPLALAIATWSLAAP